MNIDIYFTKDNPDEPAAVVQAGHRIDGPTFDRRALERARALDCGIDIIDLAKKLHGAELERLEMPRWSTTHLVSVKRWGESRLDGELWDNHGLGRPQYGDQEKAQADLAELTDAIGERVTRSLVDAVERLEWYGCERCGEQWRKHRFDETACAQSDDGEHRLVELGLPVFAPCAGGGIELAAEPPAPTAEIFAAALEWLAGHQTHVVETTVDELAGHLAALAAAGDLQRRGDVGAAQLSSFLRRLAPADMPAGARRISVSAEHEQSARRLLGEIERIPGLSVVDISGEGENE